MRSHVRFTYQGTVYHTGWAPSGGCYRDGHGSHIYDYRVCIEAESCAGWVRQWRMPAGNRLACGP